VKTRMGARTRTTTTIEKQRGSFESTHRCTSRFKKAQSVCEAGEGMRPVKTNWRLVGATLCGAWLGMTGVAAGPPDISPSNPTVSVGQSVQFTLNGAIVPTGVSAGGEYTCVRLSDATMQCTGRNQFGQLGDGTIN